MGPVSLDNARRQLGLGSRQGAGNIRCNACPIDARVQTVAGSPTVGQDVQYALTSGNYRGRVVSRAGEHADFAGRSRSALGLAAIRTFAREAVSRDSRPISGLSWIDSKGSNRRGAMQPREAFLSHSSEDRAMAQRIAEMLGARWCADVLCARERYWASAVARRDSEGVAAL